MSNGIGFTFSQEPKMPNNASKVTNQFTLRAEEEASAEMGNISARVHAQMLYVNARGIPASAAERH
ncbi:hypothetical protein [Pseudorhodoferax sp. Leaf265]|uniref:hypothetical protein n=1 Tax=Pseudorhodoferax sp. Leaf265 TaxID=1736315 RepID=UPI0012E9263F|nr:hypothetical protein [Pseudorhodoferax sp. Leaf265]